MKAGELFLFAALGFLIWQQVKAPDGPAPGPIDPAYQAFVGRVANTAHKVQLGRFFRDAADVVRRDGGRIASTEHVARQLDKAGELAFRGSDMGNYGVFGLAETTITQHMGGKPNAPLDAASRGKLASCLEGIATAIER